MFLTPKEYVVETGEMSVAEIEQMSAAETRPLPPTPQLPDGLAPLAAGVDGVLGNCLVSAADICSVSTTDIDSDLSGP